MLCCPPPPTLPLPRKTQNVLAAPPSFHRSPRSFQRFHIYYLHAIVIHLYYFSVILSCHLVTHTFTRLLRLTLDNNNVIKLIIIKTINMKNLLNFNNVLNAIYISTQLSLFTFCVYTIMQN